MYRTEAELARSLKHQYPTMPREDVEDALGEATLAYERAVREAQTTVYNIEAYRMCVAKRSLMRSARRRRTTICNGVSDRDWEQVETAVGATDATETPRLLDARLDVERLLTRLPIHYRQVLKLHYLEGRPLEETARLLGITDVCARKRHERALRKARQLLGEGV
jgi:RNA polymerase sigma factor (sigma-70 family)